MFKFTSNRVAVLKAIDKAGLKGIRDACLLVEKDAKFEAPVDDGHLRASITHRVQDTTGKVVGEVGSTIEYAPYQEFGTIHQSGTPFLRPAFRMNSEQIKKILSGALSEEVGK